MCSRPSLGPYSASGGTHRVPSGLQSVQLDPSWDMRVELYLIPQGQCGSGERWCRRTSVCYRHISRTWSWEANAHPLTPLPPSSVLSACVAHTDGNNFLQLLEQVGEACSLPCEGASHSRSPSPSGCREPFQLPSHPRSCSSHPVPPCVDGVLPWKIPCFCVPLSSAPLYHLSWSCRLMGTCL